MILFDTEFTSFREFRQSSTDMILPAVLDHLRKTMQPFHK